MLRAMRRELETGLRRLLHGHAGGNPGHGQRSAYGLPRQFPTLQPVARVLRARRWPASLLDTGAMSDGLRVEGMLVIPIRGTLIARVRPCPCTEYAGTAGRARMNRCSSALVTLGALVRGR